MESYAGFAGSGMNVGIDYLHSRGGFFGLSASAGYAILNFDGKAYRSEYERILNDPGEVTVTAGNYQILKGVVGLTGKFPEFYHTEIFLIVQAGYALSIHPEIIVNHSQMGIINSVGQVHDWTGISNLGMKINYNISEKYGVNFNYCLNFLYPGFQDEGYISLFSLPERFANINIGLIINL